MGLKMSSGSNSPHEVGSRPVGNDVMEMPPPIDLNVEPSRTFGLRRKLDFNFEEESFPSRVFHASAPVKAQGEKNVSKKRNFSRSDPQRGVDRVSFHLVDEDDSEHTLRHRSPSPTPLFSQHFFCNSPSLENQRCPMITNVEQAYVSITMHEALCREVGELKRKVSSLGGSQSYPCVECDCCSKCARRLTIKNYSKKYLKVSEGVLPHAAVSYNQLDAFSEQELASMFDPATLAEIIDFQLWFLVDNLAMRELIPVPGCEFDPVSRSWFAPLYYKRFWIDDKNMDAMVELVAYQQREAPQQWGNIYTFLPCACWEGLTRRDLSFGRGLLQPFIDGERPANVAMQWEFVDSVYGVGNISRSHWILYEISIKSKRIIVYDSMSRRLSWDQLAPYFDVMAINIPALLYPIDSSIDVVVPRWEVYRYTHPPQQVNTYDCGIMVIEFLSCLLHGRSIETVDPRMSAALRLKYCGMLHKYGKDVINCFYP